MIRMRTAAMFSVLVAIAAPWGLACGPVGGDPHADQVEGAREDDGRRRDGDGDDEAEVAEEVDLVAADDSAGGDASAPSAAPTPRADGGAGAPDPRCEGFTEILGPSTNTVRHRYPARVRAACIAAMAMCAAGVSDTRKILCSAVAYDGVYYGNGDGGEKAAPFYGFTAPAGGNYGLRPVSWVASNKPGLNATNLLESSGLAAVALLDAYAFSSANLYCSGQFTSQRSPALLERVARADIRPGDILAQSFGCDRSTDLVAIAASPVDPSGYVVVYEAYAWNRSVHFALRSLANFAGWSRFKPAAAGG
jgi:hypothetical protein